MTGERPCLFLDRDGVLNVDTGYVGRFADIQWISGTAETVRTFNQAGWDVVVVSNQSGVARGFFSFADVELLHRQMNEALQVHGACINAFYFCPYHPQGVVPEYRANHPDRKPGTGMIERAIKDRKIDRNRSFLVGDKESDREAAYRARLRFYMFHGGDLKTFLEDQGQIPPPRFD